MSPTGAGDEARTRYLHLGKVALYQMSYARIDGAQSRNRTSDTGIFSPLLYLLSYLGKMATEKGLEPSTSSVTGWRSNQLNYSAIYAPFAPRKVGGGNNRARTCDPMLVRHVLSQLSYAPVRILCETACVIIAASVPLVNGKTEKF